MTLDEYRRKKVETLVAEYFGLENVEKMMIPEGECAMNSYRCSMGFTGRQCDIDPCSFCPRPYRLDDTVSVPENTYQEESRSIEPVEKDYLVTGTIQLLVQADDETEAIIKFKDAVNDRLIGRSDYPMDPSNGAVVDDVREF